MLHIRNRAALVLAGLLACMAPMLMAPSGGFPSRPQFQSASVGNIGGTNPLHTGTDAIHLFEINYNNAPPNPNQLMAVTTFGNAAGFQNDLHWNRIEGTPASPSAVLLNDTFMSMGYRGWDGTASLSGSMAAYYSKATENWDSTHHGISFEWDVTPSGGSSTRQNIFELAATSAANLPSVITNGTGSTSVGYLQFKDAAGTRFGYAGKAGSANSSITYESDAGLDIVPSNGVNGKLSFDNAGNLTSNLSGSAPWASPSVQTTAATATSSTTLTNTNIGATLPVSWVMYHCTLSFHEITSGTGGIKFAFAGTATFTAQQGVKVGTVGGSATGPLFIAPVVGSPVNYATVSTTAGADVLMLDGVLQLTVAGTVFLQLAQNSSSANTTFLDPGSYCTFTHN